MTERKSITITWRIKNFSFCWQKEERELPGPTFVIERLQGSKWTLFLFPRASRYKEEGSMACYLHHESEENGSHEIEIGFELSALGSDGLPLETVSFIKCKMQGNDWSSPLLLKKKTVFLEKRDAFLPKDSLTVLCRIWQINQENINSERYFATTRIELQKVSLFGVVKKNDDCPIQGQRYHVQFISVSTETSPIFINVRVTQEGLSYAVIKQAESKLLKFCKCKLHFSDATGKEIAYGQGEFQFDIIPLYWDEPNWILPLTFTEQNTTSCHDTWNMNPHLEMDNLNLQCEIAYSIGIVTENIEKVDYSINTFQNGCRLKGKRQKRLPSLKDDMFSLMTNADSCDIKLRTVNKTFPAHRIILSARSLFFKNKLDQKNKGETIYVADLDNETLYQMLVFLYTDTIENFELGNVMKLYIAGAKYGIPSLKDRCFCFLQNNLDASICCAALQLADQYQDGALKKAALNYILENGDEVIGSDKWQDLERFTELKEEVLCLKTMKN
ncbi:hypothetical protein AVEN_25494-1 [Araneus ventricosus]|uniref:TD and POZ domain-containing protein 4 n=1 Tax=Araneus ventricosus TaxID=182803 RepID=A0A4Y2CSX9_ARAVE|nr:hypothetical protein AVEN_25494-1 [Araneus ventricosus]